jgi:hypothetical protein
MPPRCARIAHDEAQMIQAETLGDEPVLPLHHVVVIVGGKFGAEPVGRLCRLSRANRVWQNDKVFAGIERLAVTEQFAGEGFGQHAGAEP